MKTKGQSPAPLELSKWDIAEKFGWTLDYIDSLSIKQVHEYYQIIDARNKARNNVG